MSTDAHPTLFDLEALQVGEGNPWVQQHTAICAVCRAYVAELSRDAARFRAARDPDAFVRRIRARVETSSDNPITRAPSPPASWRRRLAVALPGLAAAAALWVLLVRPAGPADQIQAKGGIQVTGVVLHDGAQLRQVGAIAGVPGDRFRVEVALTAPAVLEAVVVDEQHRVTILAEPTPFAAGTHYLRAALTFDDTPTVARLLVGPPDGVGRALDGHVEPGVAVLPVRSAGRRR
jgi:hypothetical protein